MTTSREILAHFGLSIGTASKRDVLAAFHAADGDGTIQSCAALRLFGAGSPELHTCMQVGTALRHLGCVEVDQDTGG